MAVALLSDRLAEIDLILVGECARRGTGGGAEQRAGDRPIEQQAGDTAGRRAHGATGERAILGARATCGSGQGHAIHHSSPMLIGGMSRAGRRQTAHARGASRIVRSLCGAHVRTAPGVLRGPNLSLR